MYLSLSLYIYIYIHIYIYITYTRIPPQAKLNLADNPSVAALLEPRRCLLSPECNVARLSLGCTFGVSILGICFVVRMYIWCFAVQTVGPVRDPGVVQQPFSQPPNGCMSARGYAITLGLRMLRGNSREYPRCKPCPYTPLVQDTSAIHAFQYKPQTQQGLCMVLSFAPSRGQKAESSETRLHKSAADVRSRVCAKHLIPYARWCSYCSAPNPCPSRIRGHVRADVPRSSGGRDQDRFAVFEQSLSTMDRKLDRLMLGGASVAGAPPGQGSQENPPCQPASPPARQPASPPARQPASHPIC